MDLLSDIIDAKPSNYEEAVEKKVWKDVMLKQYHLIMKNDVWDVVLRQEQKSVLTYKWIYKIKHSIDGRTDKYNTRFMTCGFSHNEVIDYDETFSLMARYTFVRAIIALAAKLEWKLHQMDMKNVFLNSVVEE